VEYVEWGQVQTGEVHGFVCLLERAIPSENFGVCETLVRYFWSVIETLNGFNVCKYLIMSVLLFLFSDCVVKMSVAHSW